MSSIISQSRAITTVEVEWSEALASHWKMLAVTFKMNVVGLLLVTAV